MLAVVTVLGMNYYTPEVKRLKAPSHGQKYGAFIRTQEGVSKKGNRQKWLCVLEQDN